MAIFASDTMAGTAGTLLENHPLGVGGTWAKGAGRAGSMVLTPTNTVRLSAGEGAYFAAGTPGGTSPADYDVEADFVFATASGYLTLVLRGNTAGTLGYMVGVDNGGTWVIYRDTSAQQSVAVGTVAAGAVKHVKGTIRGNVITMYVDGVQILTWTDAASTYTAAGQVGIHSYGVGDDTHGMQLQNFVATDLVAVATTTNFTLGQIQSLGALYALTKTVSGRTSPYGNSDGIELQVNGTRAILDIQNPTTCFVSVDGQPYTQGVDDGTGKLLCFTGLADAPHALRVKTSEGYAGMCGIAAVAALAVSGNSPAIDILPGYGPWHTVGSYEHADPSTYTAGGFDANDPWLKNLAASTFAFQANDKFSQPTVKFRAKAASVWLWCGSGDVPRCSVDGHQLAAVPYVAPTIIAGTGTSAAGWVKVADLDEPAGSATTGITTGCEHEFSITLGNYTSTQNGSPIYRVMIGGAGAAFSATRPASDDYLIAMGDSITQGQSYGGANYDGTAGSYAYHAALKMSVMPYLNGLAGTRIADLQSRFATAVAGVGTALSRAPKAGVIYMGSNDQNVAGDPAFIAAYQDCIAKWVAAYPTAPLFCLGLKRDVGGTYNASAVSGNIATAVSNYQTANPAPGARIHFIDMSPPTNIDGELHPSNIGARIMGDYVAAQVKGVLSPSSSAVATTYSLILPATSTVGETQSIVILFDAPLTTATTVTLVDASATLGNGGSVTVAIGSAYGIITRAAGSAGSHTLRVSHTGQSGISDPTAGLAITDIAASVSGSVDFAAMAAYFAAHPIAADIEQIVKSPQAAQALHDEELATPQALGSDGRLLLSVGTGSGQINLSGGNLAGPVAVASNSITGISNAVIQNLPSGSGGGISPQAMTDLLASGVVKIAHDGLDNVMVEPGVNMRQSQTIVFAASAGAVAGAGTGVIVIKGGNSPTTRITSVADNRGNRNVVTLALPQ